jgi:hypothetical protein
MSEYYYKFEQGPIKSFSKFGLDEEDDGNHDQVLKQHLLAREKVKAPFFDNYEIQIPCTKDCEGHGHVPVSDKSYVKGEDVSWFAVVLLMCDFKAYFIL